MRTGVMATVSARAGTLVRSAVAGRRLVRALPVGALLVGVVLVLDGCAAADPSGGASVPAHPTTAAPTPSEPAPAPLALVAGGLSLTWQPDRDLARAGGSVTLTPGRPDAVTATFTVPTSTVPTHSGPTSTTPPGGTAAAPAGAASGVEQVLGVLVPAAGDRLTVLADGSISATGPDGGWLGGVVPGGVGTNVRALSDGRVEVSGGSGATLWASSAAVAHLQWGVREGGRSLAVTPTPWARTGAAAAEAGIWARLSQDPESATSTMRAQLDCHLLGARDKATWNLEPWRPDVDAVTMIATACNPS